MENFGTSEKVYSASEKERIKKFLKSDPHVSIKHINMVVEAESYKLYKI